MGEYLTGYHVKTDKGVIIFTGSIKQIADYFNTSDRLIYKCYYEGKRYLNQYWIVPYSIEYDKNISPSQLHEHLFTSDGKRNYEYRAGYPNRYKDSSCRRFTPL